MSLTLSGVRSLRERRDAGEELRRLSPEQAHGGQELRRADRRADIAEVEWQMWADRLAREGLSRSRIRNHLAVPSAIYGWAARPTRGLVDRNPTLAVELPPNDEQPRTRVCTAEEAAQLLAALEPEDEVAYALAFYAGLRRAEIHRPRWRDVDLDGFRLHVRKAKSEAGTDRRPPIAQPLRPILRAAWMRPGPAGGRGGQRGVG